MKRTILILVLIFASFYSLGAQQLTSEFTPDYDYRIVKIEEPEGHWTTGVFRVSYYPGTQSLFDLSESPVTVTGLTKRDVKREVRLFALAAEKPMLVFPIVAALTLLRST